MSNGPGLRERKNARTREAIERAALELALEQGFDHTTVDQIAERADVSPRTVYTRYPTKDAIVFGGVSESGPLEAALEHGTGDLVDRIVLFVRASAEGAREQGELETLRMRAILADPSLRRALRARLDEAEGLIRQRLADELGLPADDAGVRVLASGVTGLFLAILDHALANPDDPDPIQGGESGVQVLRAGLEALKARAGR